MGQLIFNKGRKQFNGERKVFSTNSTRITEYSYEKVNINPSFSNSTTDLKWIIDLNVRTNTIKLLGKKGENLCNLGVDKVFLRI